MSRTRQEEYRAIGEKIACHAGRVRAISQYLMRDDLPRRRGGKWRRLKARRTGGRGYFATSTRYVRGRSYRLRWQRYAGSPTRPIRWR